MAATWTGSLNIITPGTYTFTDNTDDLSTLFIDGTTVVNVTGAGTAASGTIFLSAGLHSYQPAMYQGGGPALVSAQYSAPAPGGTLVNAAAATTPTGAGLLSGLPTTVNVLNPAFNMTFSGNINGGGSLIKAGPGNLQLTALDTNTGTA